MLSKLTSQKNVLDWKILKSLSFFLHYGCDMDMDFLSADSLSFALQVEKQSWTEEREAIFNALRNFIRDKASG